jgi:tripartite-type tricarboxylate transporter receptor subunit TctC
MSRRAVSMFVFAAALAGLVFSSPYARAADDFYKGKTVRLIVGFSPGGGYDTYTRLIARHIDKYIPGNPTVLVQNMTGAGSLIAANFIARKAKTDGLTAATFNNALIVQKALGDKRIKVDFEKLEWIGAPSVGEITCAVMGFTGLKTLEDVLNAKIPLQTGSSRAGSTGYDVPAIMNQLMGTKFELITGYAGTAKTRLALESREINAFCSNWESLRVTARSMLEAKGDNKLIPYITMSRRFKDPEVKDLPLFREAIKDKDKLAIFQAWAAQMEFQRPLAMPPGTPKDRLDTLRTAFRETLKDPELLAEAKKAKIDLAYVSGQEVTKLVKQILDMPPEAKKSLSFLVRK